MITKYSNYVLPSSDPLRVPSLVVDRVTNSTVVYQVRRNDHMTNALIIGYEVIRFGIPMVGEYVNRGGRVTISPAVPGAQYRITAWAINGNYNGSRSATPAVVSATTGKKRECGKHKMSIIPTSPVHHTSKLPLFFYIKKNYIPMHAACTGSNYLLLQFLNLVAASCSSCA